MSFIKDWTLSEKTMLYWRVSKELRHPESNEGLIIGDVLQPISDLQLWVDPQKRLYRQVSHLRLRLITGERKCRNRKAKVLKEEP